MLCYYPGNTYLQSVHTSGWEGGGTDLVIGRMLSTVYLGSWLNPFSMKVSSTFSPATQYIPMSPPGQGNLADLKRPSNASSSAKRAKDEVYLCASGDP